MRQALKRNGLSIALFAIFVVLQLGLSVVGQRQHNQERENHNQPPVEYLDYVSSGAFLEATMENWESEFLQMFAYVLMTAYLFQHGSAETKRLGVTESVDRDPRRQRRKPGVPWPVRRGGVALRLYENSLSMALFLLFALSFALHAIGGAEEHSRQELAHGREALGVFEYMGTAQFWFESLQNWQSEFFSIGVLVVLTIWLRQRGSPESKPVASLHRASSPD